MTYFNFLTGKKYNSEISVVLEKYCKNNNLKFHGFCTVTQARKQFIKVKKGIHGVKCPIKIASAVRCFYLFPLTAFTTCDDKRSKRKQKAEPNSDQADKIIRFYLPQEMTEKERKEQIAAAQKLQKENEKASLRHKISTYNSYIYMSGHADKDAYKVCLDHRSEAQIKDEYMQAHYTYTDTDVTSVADNKNIMSIDADAYSNADFINAYIF